MSLKMTDIAALARQLAELDKVATPGPWHNDGYRIYAPTDSIDKRDGEVLTDYKHLEAKSADADLFIFARNNLPAILRALCVMAAVNSIRAESTAPFDHDDVQARADELLAECAGAKRD